THAYANTHADAHAYPDTNAHADANADANAHADADPRTGHRLRNGRGQPDRPSNFRCDRHVRKSHHHDEWEWRLYLPERSPATLHADRRRRPPLPDKHAVGECGARSDGDCHRPA